MGCVDADAPDESGFGSGIKDVRFSEGERRLKLVFGVEVRHCFYQYDLPS